jgi:hypothetical protein
MDYLDDLSNLFGFDLTSKDDRMLVFLVQMFLGQMIATFSFFRWPCSTGCFTLLCLTQMYFGIVPQDHDYWNGLAIQSALTWIVSMLLGKLSEFLVSFCWRNARNACNFTVKLLLVWPGSVALRVALCVYVLYIRLMYYLYVLHSCRCVSRAIARFVAGLKRALVAFNGSTDTDTDIPDNENDHNTLGDFHDDSVCESESDADPDFELDHSDGELEYDTDISDDEFQEAKDRASKGDKDASPTPSILTEDTEALTASGLDQQSSRIRSGSQSSNVRRLHDSSDESDAHEDSSEESDAHSHSE